MLMNRRARYLLFLIIIPAGITFSCKHSAKTSEEANDVKTPVTLAPVIFKSVSSTIALPAVSTYMNKSSVRATTTGIIEKILITPGEFIAADQLLFTIRTREAMALDKRISSDSTLSFKGLINISSGKEGAISAISHQKGDFVQEGDELAVISEQSSLVFILDIPFELEKYVEKNRNCSIVLPDGRHINGTITGKMPEMDMQSQTIRYIIRSQSAERLPGNLIATINLVKSTKDKALVLPKKAILGDETQTTFWVMKLLNDSTAIKIIVNKGFENNEEVEIINPIFLPSDRIILTGNYGLPDTARVTIIKE
jgi:hypothetical protein